VVVSVKNMPACKWCGCSERGFNTRGFFFPTVRIKCAGCQYATRWYVRPIGAFREWCEPRV
jgi:hypothetical protein